MATIVIMPGGFHPFHAGHMALYNSARRAFPDADVYVAATDDTSSRPFPFAVKEKLAQLAGVEAGHFVQVKSPFQAVEITSKFDPAKDQLIFVRSEKDQGQPPVPGRVKKDGSPGYLQPLLGAKKLEPFAKHAYMAYLPTVEFGPGFKSATEIRRSWPELDERQKTALVMSLYPAAQKNPKLAQTVVGMFDQVMGGQPLSENVNQVDFKNNLLSILQQKYPDAEFRLRSDGVESTDGQLTVIADTAEEGNYVGCFMWDVATGPYKGALAQAIQQTTDQLLQSNPGKKPALFISGDNQNPEAWSHIAKKLKYKLITDEDELEEGAPIVVMPSPERLKKPEPPKQRYMGDLPDTSPSPSTEKRGVKGRPGQRPMPDHNVTEGYEPGDKITWYYSNHFPEIEGTVVGWKDGHLIVTSVDPSPRNTEKTVVKYRVPKNNILSHTKQNVEENQGFAATFTAEQDGQCAGGDPGGGMMASYQKRENRPVAEKKEKSRARDAELIKALQYVKQHYPNYAGDQEMAMAKWMQRSIKHSELNDAQHDQALKMLNSKIDALAKIVKTQKTQQMEDYIEESRKK